MEIKELYIYKMNAEENSKWDDVAERVRYYCEQLGILTEYSQMIKNAVSTSVYYEHSAGYCAMVGYYYIENGDRNALFLNCQTPMALEMCFFIMHQKILREIGRKIEMVNRKEFRANWNHINQYDSRKMWFEYVISNMSKIFAGEKVEQIITQYTGYMNRWFYDEHWKFDRELMEFVEVSDSKEHD